MKHLLLIQPNLFLRKLYAKALWHGKRDEKTIYLTFDDGPVPVLSEWVLDELKKFNAKATFFCVGQNIHKHPSVFNRITGEGHLAANHTMYHSKGFKNSTAAYVEEVEACEKLTNNRFFRPPHGQLRRGQYKALIRKGYNIVFWDVISYDFENIPETICARNVIKNSRNGSIVLFHDNFKAERNLRYALPLVLRHFSDQGYNFRSLDKIN
jgi:peptidoglycan/xylan/chitin deacetylase (PgdA/CDA1 family)